MDNTEEQTQHTNEEINTPVNKESSSIRAKQSIIEIEQDSKGDTSFFLAEQFVHPYFDEDPSLGLLKKNIKNL